MKKLNTIKYQTCSLIFILIFCFLEIQAQQTTLSSGGNATGSGGSISFSVGQVFYTTYTSSNENIAQGVQQPFEIMGVLGVNDFSGININLSAYPNPTTNFLNLSLENVDVKNLLYQICDITGKQLTSKKITSLKTTIEMAQYPVSVYFLKVINQQKPIKTFKIIKN